MTDSFDLAASIANLPKPDVARLWFHAVGDENWQAVADLSNIVGFDVNISSDYDGDTVLHRAASYRKSDAVARLLAIKGIDPNKANNDGNTPLISAAKVGDEKSVVHLLADDRVDPNGVNINGYTALTLANYQGFPMVVELLLAVPGIDRTEYDKKMAAKNDPVVTRPKPVTGEVNSYEKAKKALGLDC